MDNILEKLWYGNVAPWEQTGRHDREYKELAALLCRNRDRLTEGLTEAQKELLEKFRLMLLEYNQKYNLTAILEEKDIYYKHFLDSAAGVDLFKQNASL